MNRKKLEQKIGSVVIDIILSIIGTGLILGAIALIGFIEQFIESHLWLLIPLVIIIIKMIISEINK